MLIASWPVPSSAWKGKRDFMSATKRKVPPAAPVLCKPFKCPPLSLFLPFPPRKDKGLMQEANNNNRTARANAYATPVTEKGRPSRALSVIVHVQVVGIMSLVGMLQLLSFHSPCRITGARWAPWHYC